ncbi:Iron-sulfur cluster-binding protein [Methanosarcina siciliae HI350]|uniref:Iron-sulfur cluster-binding protein n=2 Tax=Methanosarcina siciliae TaxID=38027 RepID=A0A0E3LBG9_9EURY|nr:Iron-sulfur cluster-binding protein [Methanosarcina siciliae HI350]
MISMNSRVSIVRCSDYSGVKASIQEALTLIGGLENIISPGNRVLLKPNVLAIRAPEAAVTTHPAVVAAMCELVREAGGIPVIGDGSGIAKPGSTTTSEAFRASGIEGVASVCGAELINFETSGYTEVVVSNARQFPSLYIAKAILEADVVISLPKLKTHELTLYTGAVKNFFGAVPQKIRKQAHALEDRDRFGEAVVDIYSVVKPRLAVMDGVVGMEGNGPANGTPIVSGVVLVSYDCVALDIVASELIGIDPLKVPTNKAALSRGFGTQNPDISGVPLQDSGLRFKMPEGGATAMVPSFLMRALRKQLTVKPFINTSKCAFCKACVMNCSAHAIEEVGSALKINQQKCIQCYCCRELCPKDAVEIKKSFLMKIVTRNRT